MSERYTELVRRLRESVLGSSGATAPELRRAVEARAAVHGGRPGSDEAGEVPADVASFVDKVARRAYQITDDDVAAVRAAGYSEDAVFEITATAALGSALGRLERGMAALKGEV